MSPVFGNEFKYSVERMVYMLKSSIAGGMIIGIAGTAYVSMPNPIIGAMLFSVGLMTILFRGIPLYTGAINTVFEKDGFNIIELVYILVGNFIGATVFSWLVVLLPNYQDFVEPRLLIIASRTLSYSFVGTLAAAMLCGMFMYLAAMSFRNRQASGFIRGIIVILSVMGFILTGSLHSIANIFYIAASPIAVFGSRSVLSILTMILGNTIGSLLIAALAHRPHDATCKVRPINGSIAPQPTIDEFNV